MFEFEGKPLTSKPFDSDGKALMPGDHWVGPHPGIPYKLNAGGQDISYKSLEFTDTSPPQIRKGLERTVSLSSIIKDKSTLTKITRPIVDVRGHQGGRFYVNEHKAIFTPVDGGGSDGQHFVYCGQVTLDAWFPEPSLVNEQGIIDAILKEYGET